MVAKIRQISDPTGYFARFYEILPQFSTQRAAWEALEDERAEMGLSERYNSYESFRVCKHRTYHRFFRINTGEQ